VSLHIKTKPKTPTKEDLMREKISKHMGINFKKANYEYNRFDSYTEHYLLELKHREKDWDPWMIEMHKYSDNVIYAQEGPRANGPPGGWGFLYATEYEDKIWIYDIFELRRLKYDFRWVWRDCPKTTEFSDTSDQRKCVGWLPKDRAFAII